MIHAKERMYTTDSGVSLHMVEPFSWKNNEKRLVRQYSRFLIVNYCKRFVVSDTQVQVHIVEVGTFQWVHWVEDSPSMLSLEEDNTVNLVVLLRGRLAECSIKIPNIAIYRVRQPRATCSK